MSGMVDINLAAFLVQCRVVGFGCTQVQVRIIILKAIHHSCIYVHVASVGGGE